MTETLPPAAARAALVEEKVLDVVRSLAAEVGGGRAARAVTPSASLERDLGLGSLERVELLLRLEGEFGRRLGDQALNIDTPAGLARAVLDVPEVSGRVGPAADDAVALSRAAAALPPFATVHEALVARAQAEPGRPHVFLREDDGREHVVTYGRLWSESAAVAGGLRE